MLRKGIEMGFKDIDVKKGIVSGYFSSFNNVDSHGEVILPGSYKKTVEERGPNGKGLIKWLLDHNTEKLLGSLQELKEDNVGLLYSGKVGRHTLAQDFLLMVEDGLINQHSVGFYVVKEKFDKDSGINYISEIKLLEGSSLQFLGSNENTPVLGVKSLDEAMDQVRQLEQFVRHSKASDQTLSRLDKKLESLRATIQPLISTEEKSQEPNISEMRKEILQLFN